MVLPGGSDISYGKDLKKKRIVTSRFQVLKGLCKETCGI